MSLAKEISFENETWKFMIQLGRFDVKMAWKECQQAEHFKSKLREFGVTI